METAQYEPRYFRKTFLSKDFDGKCTSSLDYRLKSKRRKCIEKSKDEGGGGGDKAGVQFSTPLQDQKNCQDIHGKGVDGKIEDYSDYEDSWSSDGGKGISVEELKQTKGYQLFKEALQAHAKNSAKSV